MFELVLLGRVVVAGVLIASGTSKALDPAGTRDAVRAFGVPPSAVPAVVVGLPAVELAVAALLLADGATGPLAALALLGTLTAAVLLNLALGRRPECHCFGRWGSSAISGRTVVRNTALAGAAAAGFLDAHVGVPAFLAARSPADLAVVMGSGAALALAVLTLEAGAGRRDAAQSAADEHARFAAELEQGRTDRGPAPGFTLGALTGATVRMEDLLDADRPLLLAFLSPGCGPCKQLRPFVSRWAEAYADRLRVAVVASGSVGANRASFGDSGIPVLLDTADVAAAFGVQRRPSAVLVGGDGRLLGPLAEGDLSVRRLAAAALSGELSGTGSPEVEASALDLSSAPGPRATVVQAVDDESGQLVVADEVSGARASLDAVGAVVWMCLDGRSPLSEVVRDLADGFGAPRDVVAADVLRLVRHVGDLGLLAGVAAGPSEEPQHARTAEPVPV